METPGLVNKWEAKKPLVFGKDFFQLQFDFAKAIQEKTSEPLFDVIKAKTGLLRRKAFNYEDNRFVGFKEGVTEENIVDFAYSEYLKDLDKNDLEPAEYHPGGSRTFGCFSHFLEKDDSDTIEIHFQNNEFNKVGPLDKSKVELRKKELHDMLIDIKTKYPHVKNISGLSWLYNLTAYRRLFPTSYIGNLEPDYHREQWKRGTTIWGQFFDSEYKLRQPIVEELLRKVRELPVEIIPEGNKVVDLSRVFEGYDTGKTNLKPPLKTHGPIQDFYDMYGISN
jgi:hypothetical protein